MEKMITAYFEDQFQNREQVEIPITAIDEDNFEVAAEDLATEWYYDVATSLFYQIWQANGGGDLDYEYNNAFDEYLENCTINWRISEDN